MKKKIFSTLLMGAFFLASMSMFTSCKDYDDDINKNKSEIEALKGLISNLQSAVDANNSAIAGLDAKYATKGELSDLADKVAKLVTNQQLQDAIAAAKSELQKAIDGKADKSDLQKLSDRVDGIDTNLNNLSTDVDGIKSALNDPEKGLEAAHNQIKLQQEAIDELKKRVDGHDDDLDQLKKDLQALDDRLTADINDLKKRMEEAEKRIDTFESKLSVLTLFIDRMLTGLLVKTDYMLNGIETLPVHMLLAQPALEGVKYNEIDGFPGKRGEGTETYGPIKVPSVGMEDYHDIWNEYSFRTALKLIGFAGDLVYNPGYKYVNMFPVGHARYTLDPATATVDGGTVYFNTDYKNVTETSVYGEEQYTRAAANTAIGEEDPIIVPVSATLAQNQVEAGGVIDIPYTVNDKEKFVNTYVKNFVLGIENARTIDGYATDAAELVDFTSWSMRAPFVAANMAPAVADGHTARSIQSDWAMVVPNMINLIALADNYPNYELDGEIKGDIHVDYPILPPYYAHWSRVDNSEVAANHLYRTADEAVHSIPSHQVVYNQTIDLKPFIETHAAIFGARFTRDAPLTEQELKELGLHYEYYLVDYNSQKYQTNESAHLHQVPVDDPTSSVFAPNSVDYATGKPIIDKQEKGSIGREPIVRVELRTEPDAEGKSDVVLYGYIKLQIVEEFQKILEAEPLEFGDILMECSPGVGFLTWHQVEAGIAEKLNVSVSTFENEWTLDSDLVDPFNPSFGYGAKRFVKIDGQFYDEASYIRMVEEKYKLTDWTINDVLLNNVQFVVEYFKAFAGRIIWTHNYVPMWDPQNRQTDVLAWELGTPYSAWSHAFKYGSLLTVQQDLDYVRYITAPNKKGLSTEDVSTYVRFVKKGSSDQPIYVKLTIPAGKVRWAAGEVTNKTDQKAGNWFALNSNDFGSKEIHISVPQPRDAKDTRIGVYDKLIVERGGSEPNWNLDFDADLTDYWVNGIIKYADIAENKLSDFETFKGTPDQDKVTFYFTLPHVDKGNITNAANNWNSKKDYKEDFTQPNWGVKADTDYGTWTVKGWSGKTYTLALYKLGVDENGELLPDKPQNYTRFERVWKLNNTMGKPFYVVEVEPVQRGTEIRVIKCDGKVFGLNNEGLAYDIERIPSGTGLNPKPAEAYNAVDALGLQGYWLVRLTEQEITKTKISTKDRDASNISIAHNKYITYWRDWIAEDILNIAGHTQLAEKETFTAYLQVDYEECYPIFAENSKYFNARFLRPVNFTPLSPSAKIDAINNGATFTVAQLVGDLKKAADANSAWTDWRDLYIFNGLTGSSPNQANLWKFYGIHLDDGTFTSKGGSYGAELKYFDGSEFNWKFTELLLSEIRTDFGVDPALVPQTDRKAKDFNSLENRIKFMNLPIAALTKPGNEAGNARLDLTINSEGNLHYNNDNVDRHTFHLFVPIHWSYYFGDEFEDYTYNFFRSAPYTYAVITINFTQNNPK